jgi:hypothetical protein
VGPISYAADLAPSAASPRDLPVELAFHDDGEAHQALSLLDCPGDHVLDGRSDGLEELVEACSSVSSPITAAYTSRRVPKPLPWDGGTLPK